MRDSRLKTIDYFEAKTGSADAQHSRITPRRRDPYMYMYVGRARKENKRFIERIRMPLQIYDSKRHPGEPGHTQDRLKNLTNQHLKTNPTSTGKKSVAMPMGLLVLRLVRVSVSCMPRLPL